MKEILQAAIDQGASDIHLTVGKKPVFRLSGALASQAGLPLVAEETFTRFFAAYLRDYDPTQDCDLALPFDVDNRFRVNLFNGLAGKSAVLRLIPSHCPSLPELGAPPLLTELAEKKKGLVLVTGPTGSGKTTTLAAMIRHINETQARHILTIEDPIEFIHTPQKSLISQREIGTHTPSFSAALKSALREDPDVILVGELRDYETIAMALTAAETGHLVFGTLHTPSAHLTIDRLIDVFPTADKPLARTMLAGTLNAVVAQDLLPRADGRGRVAAFETLVCTRAIENLIRENQIPQIYSMMQTGRKSGMKTMEEAIKELLEQSLIRDQEEPSDKTLPPAPSDSLAGSKGGVTSLV